jgi:hypothetical protein
MLLMFAIVGMALAAVFGLVFFLLKFVFWAVFFPFRLLFKLLWIPVGLTFGAFGLLMGLTAIPIVLLILGGILIFGFIAAVLALILPLTPFVLFGLLLWALLRNRPATA